MPCKHRHLAWQHNTSINNILAILHSEINLMLMCKHVTITAYSFIFIVSFYCSFSLCPLTSFMPWQPPLSCPTTIYRLTKKDQANVNEVLLAFISSSQVWENNFVESGADVEEPEVHHVDHKVVNYNSYTHKNGKSKNSVHTTSKQHSKFLSEETETDC